MILVSQFVRNGQLCHQVTKSLNRSHCIIFHNLRSFLPFAQLCQSFTTQLVCQVAFRDSIYLKFLESNKKLIKIDCTSHNIIGCAAKAVKGKYHLHCIIKITNHQLQDFYMFKAGCGFLKMFFYLVGNLGQLHLHCASLLLRLKHLPINIIA